MRQRYQTVREVTERLCAPLAVEDYVVQAIPEASPAKWHLAHTTWFFETFVLQAYRPGYRPLEPQYRYLFNSYYNAVGAQFPRSERGHLSRPTVAEVYAYRAHVDKAMAELLERQAVNAGPALTEVVTLGLHHEQQHQELLLTDLKATFGANPLAPAYQALELPRNRSAAPLEFVDVPGGLVAVGHDGAGFAFDNERPRHEVHLRPYRLASRPVTNGEYLAFMDADGYQRPELWLSDGWATVGTQGWQAPLHWRRRDGAWWLYTLSGLVPVDAEAPVTHVSYYEADAYARWRGRRLPTEQEWEHAAAGRTIEGHFQEAGLYQPLPAPDRGRLVQLFGDVWEWTQSPYVAYPGFRPLADGLGEYNGKFMVNQLVLRGGSCATPRSHLRASYRNFFPPGARWQFSGIRLAEDA
ncbi:MAG: ergothioneine biosynthesis protein EgtB [Candidatus Rokuibacteriota bacterium]